MQETKLKQLQHFLLWNKANIKYSCKSQLYIGLNENYLIKIVSLESGIFESIVKSFISELKIWFRILRIPKIIYIYYETVIINFKNPDVYMEIIEQMSL